MLQAPIDSAGVFIAAGLAGWLVGWLTRRSVPSDASRRAVEAAVGCGSTCSVRNDDVKAALANLRDPRALDRCHLRSLPALSRDRLSAAELRALFVEVVMQLAASSLPRDAESGRLLLDYYVKRVGSHELIMERLHLSRPTFYRRLNRGLALVAERLDDIAANPAPTGRFGSTSPKKQFGRLRILARSSRPIPTS